MQTSTRKASIQEDVEKKVAQAKSATPVWSFSPVEKPLDVEVKPVDKTRNVLRGLLGKALTGVADLERVNWQAGTESEIFAVLFGKEYYRIADSLPNIVKTLNAYVSQIELELSSIEKPTLPDGSTNPDYNPDRVGDLRGQRKASKLYLDYLNELLKDPLKAANRVAGLAEASATSRVSLAKIAEKTTGHYITGIQADNEIKVQNKRKSSARRNASRSYRDMTAKDAEISKDRTATAIEAAEKFAKRLKMSFCSVTNELGCQASFVVSQSRDKYNSVKASRPSARPSLPDSGYVTQEGIATVMNALPESAVYDKLEVQFIQDGLIVTEHFQVLRGKLQPVD
jgi:hypothetical protein